jgi:hypothetical protein
MKNLIIGLYEFYLRVYLNLLAMRSMGKGRELRMVRYEEYIRNFAKKLSEEGMIAPDAFPDMPLYADQVAQHLSSKLSFYGSEPQLTKSMISNYVKKKLIPSPEAKKYNREQMIMIALILILKRAYKLDDVELIMNPFVANITSDFDDSIDFCELYENLMPLFEERRANAAKKALANIDCVKCAIRDRGIEDDDRLEIFLVLLSIAIEVDTAQAIGQRLLTDYLGKEKALREKAPKERTSKEKALREKTPKERASKEKASREKALKEKGDEEPAAEKTDA